MKTQRSTRLAPTGQAPTRLTMVGGGSWATALIKILSENNVSIKWWLRKEADAEHIRTFSHNPSYLSDVQINTRKVKVCTKIRDAFRDSDYVILAVPAAFVADALTGISPEHVTGKRVVSAIKGMIPAANQLVTDWVADHYGVSPEQIAVIAGPLPRRRSCPRKTIVPHYCLQRFGLRSRRGQSATLSLRADNSRR